MAKKSEYTFDDLVKYTEKLGFQHNEEKIYKTLPLTEAFPEIEYNFKGSVNSPQELEKYIETSNNGDIWMVNINIDNISTNSVQYVFYKGAFHINTNIPRPNGYLVYNKEGKLYTSQDIESETNLISDKVTVMEAKDLIDILIKIGD